jgi:hypothetical protein
MKVTKLVTVGLNFIKPSWEEFNFDSESEKIGHNDDLKNS